MEKMPEPIADAVGTDEPPTRDIYLGAEGYFDGSDASLILQDSSKLFSSERREIEAVYGNILDPLPAKEQPFSPTMQLLRQLNVAK